MLACTLHRYCCVLGKLLVYGMQGAVQRTTSKPAPLDVSNLNASIVKSQDEPLKDRTPVAKRVKKMEKQHQAVGGGPVAPSPPLAQAASGVQVSSVCVVPSGLEHCHALAIALSDGLVDGPIGGLTTHAAVRFAMQLFLLPRQCSQRQSHKPGPSCSSCSARRAPQRPQISRSASRRLSPRASTMRHLQPPLQHLRPQMQHRSSAHHQPMPEL
jgi:hypothetical protein